MKVAVLGSTGMLGFAVGRYFLSSLGEDAVFLSFRNPDLAYGKNQFYYRPLLLSAPCPALPSDVDYVINCIGIIKPHMRAGRDSAVFLNAIFPRRLADMCEAAGAKLIHITTDCVFSGKSGSYTEESLHDCTDAYGKSKSLGEPDNCMVLRTSIIGPELHSGVSLVEWLRSQSGGSVKGFTNHLWNGVTTWQYADICLQIIRKSLFECGTYHLVSETVTKFDLLKLLDKIFGFGVRIEPSAEGPAVDRTLDTVKGLSASLEIADLEAQIKDTRKGIEPWLLPFPS